MRAIGFLLLALVLAAGMPVQAQDKGQTVRPEVGKPMQAAIDLLKQRRSREALSKAQEAAAIPDKTPYETYMANRVLGQSAAAAGDAATAARAFEAVSGASVVSETERRQFLLAAASEYYRIKEYAKSADLAGRYLSLGGTDRAARQMQAQGYYLSGNHAAAAKVLSAEIEAEERAGKAPAEDQLQLLLTVYNQLRDGAGSARVMDKLLVHHPKKDYWLNVLHGVTTAPGFNARLAIDVARLKLDTGTLRTADEYMEAAQLSLQDGFPFEASKILEEGYAAGLLGTGADAARHKRLRDLTAKNLAEDRKTVAQEDAGAAKDGKTLFNEGFNLVLHGKADKGLPMMEQGLKLGSGFKRPEHARLQLAHAYHLAGQNQKAVQIYRTIQGNDGAGSLARFWTIRLTRGSG